MFSAFCEILCARTRRARSYALKPLADLRRGLDLARVLALNLARILRVDLRRGLDLVHIITKDLARILLADLMRGLGAGATVTASATVTTPATTTAFARRAGPINPALSIAGYNFQGDLARLKLRFKNA